jgi:hypothetical protein
MEVVEQLASVTIERLRKQSEFLLRTYQTEFDKDPSSHATESSRSNVIARRRTGFPCGAGVRRMAAHP